MSIVMKAEGRKQKENVIHIADSLTEVCGICNEMISVMR